MKKHADVFHAVMLAYAIGLVASIVFQRNEPSNPALGPVIAIGTAAAGGQSGNAQVVGRRSNASRGFLDSFPAPNHDKDI